MATNDQQQGSEQDIPEVDTPTTAQQDGTPEQPEPAEDGKGGNKEAAGYRRRLRDTEAERDALVETVSVLQRQIVGDHLPHGSKLGPDALWLAGRKPGEFFDEKSGQLNSEKLTAAVREVHKALSIRFGADPVPQSGGGSGAGLRDEPATLAGEARKRRG